MKILSIDAWADSEPGSWTWNNWFQRGAITKEEFEALDTDEKRVEYMIGEGYLSDDARTGVDVEDDQYNVVFADKETGEPLFAIEYGPEY